jgi:hypothetical protein
MQILVSQVRNATAPLEVTPETSLKRKEGALPAEMALNIHIFIPAQSTLRLTIVQLGSAVPTHLVTQPLQPATAPWSEEAATAAAVELSLLPPLQLVRPHGAQRPAS